MLGIDSAGLEVLDTCDTLDERAGVTRDLGRATGVEDLDNTGLSICFSTGVVEFVRFAARF